MVRLPIPSCRRLGQINCYRVSEFFSFSAFTFSIFNTVSLPEAVVDDCADVGACVVVAVEPAVDVVVVAVAGDEEAVAAPAVDEVVLVRPKLPLPDSVMVELIMPGRIDTAMEGPPTV